MSASTDRAIALGLVVAWNASGLLRRDSPSMLEKIVQNLFTRASENANRDPVFTFVGLLTVGQAMLAVYGIDRLTSPDCRQITSDLWRRFLFVGLVMIAFLLPEVIFAVDQKPGTAPNGLAKMILAGTFGTAALVSVRTSWHMREKKCNSNKTLSQGLLAESIVALLVAVGYGAYVFRQERS